MFKKFFTLFFSCLGSCFASHALSVNDKAPDISLQNEFSQVWSLKSHLGRVVVVYFYPADSTPGCTAQACSLKNNYGIFKKMNVEVVGISYDSVRKHLKFKTEHNLPFSLLSDPKAEVAYLYGASRWWPNLMPKRKTIIIDKNGLVRHILEDVDPATHTQQVLQLVGSLR